MRKRERTSERERKKLNRQSRREDINAGYQRPMTFQTPQNSTNLALLYLGPMNYTITL